MSAAGPTAFMATDAASPGATVARDQASVRDSCSPFLPNPCREGSCAPKQQEPVHGRPWGPPESWRSALHLLMQAAVSCWLQGSHASVSQWAWLKWGWGNAKGCACSKHPFEMGFEKNWQHPKHGHTTNLDSGSSEVLSSVYYSLPNNI